MSSRGGSRISGGGREPDDIELHADADRHDFSDESGSAYASAEEDDLSAYEDCADADGTAADRVRVDDASPQQVNVDQVDQSHDVSAFTGIDEEVITVRRRLLQSGTHAACGINRHSNTSRTENGTVSMRESQTGEGDGPCRSRTAVQHSIRTSGGGNNDEHGGHAANQHAVFDDRIANDGARGRHAALRFDNRNRRYAGVECEGAINDERGIRAANRNADQSHRHVILEHGTENDALHSGYAANRVDVRDHQYAAVDFESSNCDERGMYAANQHAVFDGGGADDGAYGRHSVHRVDNRSRRYTAVGLESSRSDVRGMQAANRQVSRNNRHAVSDGSGTRNDDIRGRRADSQYSGRRHAATSDRYIEAANEPHDSQEDNLTGVRIGTRANGDFYGIAQPTADPADREAAFRAAVAIETQLCAYEVDHERECVRDQRNRHERYDEARICQGGSAAERSTERDADHESTLSEVFTQLEKCLKEKEERSKELGRMKLLFEQNSGPTTATVPDDEVDRPISQHAAWQNSRQGLTNQDYGRAGRSTTGRYDTSGAETAPKSVRDANDGACGRYAAH